MEAKSPDPDDLTNEQPATPLARRRGDGVDGHGEDDINPDVSAPHVPRLDR